MIKGGEVKLNRENPEKLSGIHEQSGPSHPVDKRIGQFLSVVALTKGFLKSELPRLSFKEEQEVVEQAMADEADNASQSGAIFP